jgi:hypothetical protein
MARSQKTKQKKKKKQKSENSSWREFEKLVTRIEQVWSPQGAIVKSPDHLIDKTTNELREVDASIRYKIGTSEIIITIECRERAKAQDSIWIEQLASKQRDIGSSKTIAVTANGFTAPAIKKAKQYGIEVRKISKIDYESINRWVIVKTVINYHVVDWQLLPHSKFIDELRTLGQSGGFSKIIFSSDAKMALSLNDLFSNLLNQIRPEIDKLAVPHSGYSEVYKLEAEFSKGKFHLLTTAENIDLSGFKVDFTLYRSSSTIIPQVSSFTYSNEEEDIIEGKEFEIVSDQGVKEIVTIHTDIKKGISKLGVWMDLKEK